MRGSRWHRRGGNTRTRAGHLHSARAITTTEVEAVYLDGRGKRLRLRLERDELLQLIAAIAPPLPVTKT